SSRFFVLLHEGHDLARVRYSGHIQFPRHWEVRGGSSDNEGLAVEKYGIPVIHDRDALRSHPHVLRAPVKMTDDNAACRWSHDREGGARDVVGPFRALCGRLEVKTDIMRTGQIPSGSNRCGRPPMSRQDSDSLTNCNSPAAIARRTPGTLTSVATPSRLYSMAAAQPGPSGENSVRTRGAGNPLAARPACTCNCADNAFGSASPDQTFTNTLSLASCSVTAAPTLISTALTCPSPNPLVLAQARIIRSASSALSVANTLRARSLSYRS